MVVFVTFEFNSDIASLVYSDLVSILKLVYLLDLAGDLCNLVRS